MSPRDELLTRAAKVVADDADAVRVEAAPREVRARAIAAMEASLRGRARRRTQRVWGGRIALAATFVLAALGAQRVRSMPGASKAPTIAFQSRIDAVGRGVAQAWHEGRPAAFDGARLVSGDRVKTGTDGHADIVLSTGTTVALAPAADVTFTQTGAVQTFDLGSGGVVARVAKLHDAERFLVHTADAEIEVRGTVFAVSLVAPDPSCGDGVATRVEVTEGVVVVRANGRESRVGAGERWPSGCTSPVHVAEAVAAPSPKSEIAPGAASAKPVLAAGAEPGAATPLGAPAADGLSAKNDLFAAALAAQRRGELTTALAGYDAYVARYPQGELVESASAQRMVLLARLDRTRAVAAARDYLARWPAGFARADAESILATP